MRGVRLLAFMLVGCGIDERPVTPDAPPPDAEFHALCTNGSAVSVTGTTPAGSLDGLRYVNVSAQAGFCNSFAVAYTAGPEFGYPMPVPSLYVLVPTTIDDTGMPMGGTLDATVRYLDASGTELETTGTFTTQTLEMFVVGNRARGRLVVDQPPWSIDLALDATYCYFTTCF